MNLQGRSFLTLLDYTPEEIAYLLDLAAELKEKKHARITHRMQINSIPVSTNSFGTGIITMGIIATNGFQIYCICDCSDNGYHP